MFSLNRFMFIYSLYFDFIYLYILVYLLAVFFYIFKKTIKMK